jgi:sialidase-1
MTVLLAAPLWAAPQPETTAVFVGGQDGFPAVRIPSIVVTKSGALLAFCEGRKNLGDQAENKIILRRSTDGGKTWLPMQVVADDGKRPLNNPCAVVDQKSGRVLLMFQSYPEKLKEAAGQIKTGYEGEDIVKSYLIRSDDDGQTWSKIEDVTRQVKRPEKVTTVASGPGIGIQLQNGPHAGRILIPFNEGPYGKWNAYAVYSDDGGASWKFGDNVPGGTGIVNECQVVELSDGRVQLNSRQMGGKTVRQISFSKDGGQTWSPVANAPELAVASCMSSILRLCDAARPRLLFSGPRSNKRENGTIYLSYDNGQTWPIKKTLQPAFFAYSNLVALPDGALGCLYEADGYKRIVFARFALEWLTDGADKWGEKPNKDRVVAQRETPAITAPPGMKLVWNDEFDKDGPPDLDKWNPELGFIRNRDSAYQIYQLPNARVENGLLIIEARREHALNPFYKEGSEDWRYNRKSADYTSASFNTRGKASWLYGRFEIRCKIDTRISSWPAFWTVGEKGPWPHGGEIDILEFMNQEFVGNFWWGGPKMYETRTNTRLVPLKKLLAADPEWPNKFHTWAMDWDANKITLYLDGKVFHTHDVSKSVNADGTGRNPFREPQIIILNQAIGHGDPKKTEFPMRFEVDYVRVFQRPPVPQPAN